MAPALLTASAVRLLVAVAGSHRPVEATARSFTLGGGAADRYRVPGLQPGALRIHVESTRVLVVARTSAWCRGVRLRVGAPVLLPPGEEVFLTRRGRIRLVHAVDAAPAPLGTRSVLRRLLAGDEAPSGIGVARLLCIAGPELGRSLLVAGGPLELGRAPGCALRLRDAAISRWQARLWVDGETVLLEDLGSYGGTRINGRRVHAARRLAPGDLIGAGRTLLRFTAAPRPVEDVPPPVAAGTRRWQVRALLGIAAALVGVAGLIALRLVR